MSQSVLWDDKYGSIFTGGDKMYYEYDLMEKFADECVEKLKQETIEYFKMHISYTHHHFGYGLYLRNKYAERVEEERGLARDNLGNEIYIHILSKIFPEFGKDMEKIQILTEMTTFSELFAYYYMKTGDIVVKDFPISDFKYVEFECDTDDDEQFDIMFDKWEEINKNNENEYLLPIAETLWNYKELKKQAMENGIEEKDIDDMYSLAKTCLVEKFIFLPLEFVYFSKAKKIDGNISEITDKYIAYFFQNNSSKIEILPEFVFNNREFVKNAVRHNGHLLKYAKKFKNDYEIVKIAVEKSATAIQYASNKLKNNIDIVKTALLNSKYDLIFSLSCMRKYNDNDELVKLALKANGANICYTSKRIRDNYEMAKYALEHQADIHPSSAYGALSARLRDDKSLAMIELKREYPRIGDFSKRLKNDDEIGEYIYRRKKISWMMDKMSPRIQKKYGII